jgi:hypothetical protein
LSWGRSTRRWLLPGAAEQGQGWFPSGSQWSKMCGVTRVEGSTSHFAELTLAECERLLAQHKAGRVGLNASTGPQILPVTYAYYAKTIVFSDFTVWCVVFARSPHAGRIRDRRHRRRAGVGLACLGSGIGGTGDAGVHADVAVEGRPRSLGRGHTQLVHHDHPRNDHWTGGAAVRRGLNELGASAGRWVYLRVRRRDGRVHEGVWWASPSCSRSFRTRPSPNLSARRWLMRLSPAPTRGPRPASAVSPRVARQRSARFLFTG